ncbi:acyl-CoA thioesterase [Amycolatopsis alkalitolerans]|uniref:Acyl-CoA thioesterase II n=1 Tax=Amycolatopsis alkalitolerans TaxID=2547244 RepID=A0A5C4M6V3_9PSEU|nr:acyl-CoA thioesterase domain-containing protein [Amycolatopsis alkalitolerans]TNC26537.1 acyl-CoA thioesterase II [Amycolatopsis alkalitolerans]
MAQPGDTGLVPLLDLLDLEAIEEDIFRSRSTGDPGGRLFGGEVCAQALVAAERTAPPETTPHSLHAYFLRPGDTAARVVFRVDRLQDGRNFRRRRVTAIQHGEPILCLECSFTTDRSGADHQVTAPEAPDPADCAPFSFPHPTKWSLEPHDVFDVRPAVPERDGRPRFVEDLWFRPKSGKLDDRVSAAAVLTYFSDLTFVSSILRRARRSDIAGFTSLDHVLWFHNEVRFDDWLYYAKSSPAAGHLRGLAEGRFFHRDGTLIATAAQEGLIHARKEA